MMTLTGHFDRFANRIDQGAAAALVNGDDPDGGGDDFASSVEEARNAVRFLEPLVSGKMRILEVGAGFGILSAFLASQGHDVVAAEPGGQGYEANRRLSSALVELTNAPVATLAVAGESLTPAEHGMFDLIFSINVIEHVEDPDLLLRRLVRMLNRTGVMLHSCPNYRIPYEPHFGIPLVPVFHALTARLVSTETRESGLWKSLNFIDAGVVEQVAEDLDLQLRFHKGLLADALSRLNSDPSFGKRHAHLKRVAQLLIVLRLDALIRRIPAQYMTPMIFELRHSS